MTTGVTDDVLELECQLRFIGLCEANKDRPAPTGMDLYIEGFWACAEAMVQPRELGVLEAEIALRRARAAGLVR